VSRICPECSIPASSGLYCTQCGTKLPELEEPIAPEEQQSLERICCHVVGHAIQARVLGSKFCKECGRNLEIFNALTTTKLCPMCGQKLP